MDIFTITTDGNTNGVITSVTADGKTCDLLTVNGNALNGTPNVDGNSTYSQAERKRACIVNGPRVGAQSGPGTDVIGMDALCTSGGLGQAMANSGNKRERGRPNLACGTKRERTDIISPEDLPADWGQRNHQQRRNYRKFHRRKI